jgi:DNA-binding GntR family transcriptional regulator
MLTPVERSSLAIEVAKKLRMEILTGNIKPGERILEQAISAMMKTSRGPVRDALIQLEHEGLILREPNRSATVVSMTADDVEEVHSLRLSLELLALRYVLERAGDADFSRLQGVVDSLRACLNDHFSLQEAVDLDLQFHEEFVKTARNNRLLSMWQSIKPQIWFLIFSRNAYAMKSFQDAIGTHEDLLGAIRSRDLEKCKSIIQEHLDIAYAKLIETYKETHPKEKEVS